MSTIRVNDLLLVFSGGDPFSKTESIDKHISVADYHSKKSRLPDPRKLFTLACGAEEVDAEVTQVMAMIKAHVGGRFETVGQVCILGRSNGCAHALALAVQLHAAGVKELNYVGVSDVTMYAGGRKPEVPGIGPLQPDSRPDVGLGVKAFNVLGGGVVSQRIFYPSASKSPPPNISLKSSIAAKKKVNHYQTKGNHIKPKVNDGWIWWSSMTDGEVHGTVDGFENRPFDVGGLSDLQNHINLNTKNAWTRMGNEAAEAFADFPADAR